MAAKSLERALAPYGASQPNSMWQRAPIGSWLFKSANGINVSVRLISNVDKPRYRVCEWSRLEETYVVVGWDMSLDSLEKFLEANYAIPSRR